jgi:hypothetical protein
MILLDITVISVALPSIREDLDASGDQRGRGRGRRGQSAARLARLVEAGKPDRMPRAVLLGIRP